MNQLNLSHHPLPGNPYAGAVLVLPGGGYEHLADHEAEPIADWVNSLGLHAFVLRYRIAPHRHPAPIEDALAAIKVIRGTGHGINCDPDRIGVIGFSAGGHLAATLSNRTNGTACGNGTERRPDFAILCYPVISFVHDQHLGSVANLLGSDAGVEQCQQHSMERQVSAETPPTFLWHTADDGAVPVSHSLAYAEAARRAGAPIELHVFPHGRHGLGLAEESPSVARWTVLCAGWLRDLGVLK